MMYEQMIINKIKEKKIPKGGRLLFSDISNLLFELVTEKEKKELLFAIENFVNQGFLKPLNKKGNEFELTEQGEKFIYEN